MIVVPEITPVTIPLDVPIVATKVLLLLHVPTPPSVRVIVDPGQTDKGPDMPEGSGFTVMVFVVVHPVPKV